VPHPDAAIELSGGLLLDRSAWLSGHPPSIRIVGALAAPGEVTIDGQAASRSKTEDWTAADWDSEGRHSIIYHGLSRSYEIRAGPGSWKTWDAHAANGLVVCGALATDNAGHLAFAFGADPFWLLGDLPGNVLLAARAGSTPLALAAPKFEPVWAVPVQGSRRNRQPAYLVGRALEPHSTYAGRPQAEVRLWCRVLREASQGPKLWIDSEREAAELWRRYRHTARALWRRFR
jgi:hypothetical protein